MSKEPGIPLVLPLDDASATLSQVGGKGASLARMAAAGLPAPRQGLTPLRFLAHLDKGSIYCYIRRQKQRSYGMMLQEI